MVTFLAPGTLPVGLRERAGGRFCTSECHTVYSSRYKPTYVGTLSRRRLGDRVEPQAYV